jgi:hypothetical protein
MRYGRALRAIVAMAVIVGLHPATVQAADYSGTIIDVDKGAGLLIVGEVGPWRVKNGQTEITKRTLAIAPSARFVAARRSQGPGPTGWPGEFVEVPLEPWAVREGNFVTVHVERSEKGPTAVKVTVAGE